MTTLEAIFLGIVQGMTEFLPVSSSGHLVLTQNLLGWQEPNLAFNIWLHFSTLLAIVLFFWKDWRGLSKKEWLVILVGSIPAAVVGVFFADVIETWFGSTKLVAAALVVTGLFNLKTNTVLRKQNAVNHQLEVGFRRGFIIGLFQALAIIPGVSRSGSTVFAGITQGLDRIKAFKFSFFLSLPAILGASLLQLIKVWNQGTQQSISPSYFFAGLTAFMTGLASLYIFEFVIKKARIDWFGWYCLSLGIAYLVIF
ncbi:undecaprenyl-diphosphate phosphatase [Patescibacteria group bacterium]|nr:undecaprenyl-diphosphate phosphatase [Patescibacteria group bacterium]MBU1966664.1 undecaprenyl-diphosphate phosphatase [Patescibacteria group bacterium]